MVHLSTICDCWQLQTFLHDHCRQDFPTGRYHPTGNRTQAISFSGMCSTHRLTSPTHVCDYIQKIVCYLSLSNLCCHIPGKRWEKSVEQIDFTHSTARAGLFREGWVDNRLTEKANGLRPVPVTANAIANRLVEKGRYKNPNRRYYISGSKTVDQLAANTDTHVNLCEEVSNAEMAQAIHNMKFSKALGPDNIHP